MNRKEEITEQIRELTVELDGIEKVWPEEGDNYWVAPGDGTIDEQSFVNDGFDKFRRKRGLCFKTKEEATTYRDNDNLYVEIRQALKDANGDWVADYTNASQIKQCISEYNHSVEKVEYGQSGRRQWTLYASHHTSVFLKLIAKYGKLPVCRAFGIIE